MSTSQPIPISTPPHQMSSHPLPATGPKDTPGSSVSMSPQTPFLPAQNLSSTAPNPNSGILQWARSFKSPPAQGGTTLPPAPNSGPASPPQQQQKGFDIPSIHTDDHEHDHDEHDSFEFGDLSTRTWGRMGRRAVSMSMPAGQGISGMLSGFSPTSPPTHGGGAEGLGVGSPPAQMSGSVMADKTARGQGVLRRLSIGGGFAKPPMFSPPLSAAAPGPVGAQQQSNLTASAPQQDFSPPVADPVQRANTLGARGRRLSESGGKKRGVSPMGERLLRDHGHF